MAVVELRVRLVYEVDPEDYGPLWEKIKSVEEELNSKAENLILTVADEDTVITSVIALVHPHQSKQDLLDRPKEEYNNGWD